MSMKSMTMIPPMSRSRSWRTTSLTASRLFLVIVSSSRPPDDFDARADEAARVDVDDRERLGVVEDEVAAGGQVDAARERRADLARRRPERLEQRRLLAVADDALDHVRRGLLQVADDALVRALVVDERALEVLGEEVADDAQRQLGLLVDERRAPSPPSLAPRSSSRGAAGRRGRARCPRRTRPRPPCGR